MNLTEMIALVRQDLHDEDAENYRWTDGELTRHINRAVGELSESLPLPAKATLPTTMGSRELDISGLNDRIMVVAVEYKTDVNPPDYQQFSIWGQTLTILSGSLPDGSNCSVYYGARHTLDAQGTTIPGKYEDLVAGGACGYAAVELAVYSINRVNVGGSITPGELLEWGNQRLKHFRRELKRLGRRNHVSINALY
ncbi:MAG: hypothetical protein JXA17_07185 [Dehalococcoidales bacterium]|nr:hypothetical protein [Dehalococcoidales bacterium]